MVSLSAFGKHAVRVSRFSRLLNILFIKNYILFFCTVVWVLILPACKKSTADVPAVAAFSITDQHILNNGKAIQLIGANALHVFAAGSSDMNKWKLDVVREFIGNVKETPLTGAVIKDANGAYLHPMQQIADSNRANNRITIFCGFGWDGTAATVFTGQRPTLTVWWSSYLTQLKQWATQFKDQPDVWLEVWNEPYRYDRADGYTDDIWKADMELLVQTIRNAGNNNIILVPCAEQGQDESVLINKGNAFLTGKQNILFDVHAYEKWLLVSNSAMGNRLSVLQNNHLPVLFGETAPMNAGTLMNPKPLLDSASAKGFSILAWLWKYDASDQDALLDASGQPNNTNNNNWGTLFSNLALAARKP